MRTVKIRVPVQEPAGCPEFTQRCSEAMREGEEQ